MIELIDKSNGDLLVCTETEENEDIMHLGPDIKEDLLRKIEIMHNHKYEINELYKSYNVWLF